MNTAESKTVVFGNGILRMAIFMLVVFMLVMEQSFPQWDNARRDRRNFRAYFAFTLGQESDQFHQQERKDRVMNS
jgi:hypothetical protein